jgi:hypothetical protein
VRKQVRLWATVLCLLAPGFVSANVAQLDFNTDGVKPHTEAAASYPGSTVGRFGDGRTDDLVAGGLWTQVNGTGDGTDGSILYHGNIPELASSSGTSLSINARIRFNESIGFHSGSNISGEFYLNMRGAAGSIWLYFDYDKNTGASRISGRSSGGSGLWRSFPAGKTLGEFHVVTISWDPNLVDSLPAQLWVDGVDIGDTYANTAVTNTNGNVELGDGLNASGNGIFEVDWIRFGTDETVIVPPTVATPAFDPDGGFFCEPVDVTISTTTPNATLRYTLDGSIPNETSALYTGPVEITPPATLKARAWADGFQSSDVASAYYGINAAVWRFNTNGQLPHQENTSLVRTIGGSGIDDEVTGGLWKSVDSGPAENGGLWYGGNILPLATADLDWPMSINVRLRLLDSILDGDQGNFYFMMKGPYGALYLSFRYNSGTGSSEFGTRHANGSYQWRSLPPSESLADFHTYTCTLHPASGGAAPAELWFDGVNAGGGYMLTQTSTDGYVEFGDGTALGNKAAWEVDWLRFGLDENIMILDPNDNPEDMVDASTFGFTAGDATAALQAAIDTGSPRVVVPNMGSDWIIEPVFLTMSNQEIILEEGVNITAKQGFPAFESGRLFSNRDGSDIYSLFNFTMTGLGNNVLKMWQDDYTQGSYTVSESRHAIALYSYRNVCLSDLTIEDTGGDGIYLSKDPFLPGTIATNIKIQDVVVDNAYRNGITVITSDNLLVDNCVITNTSGTSPQVGIDFEPNPGSPPPTNCVVRNTILHDNFNQGVVVQLDHLADPGAATITIENCTFSGNGGGACLWSTLGLPGLVVKDCLFVDNKNGYGVLQTAATSPPSLDVTYSAFWNNPSGTVGGDATLGVGSLTAVEPLFNSTTLGDDYYMYLTTSTPTTITEGDSDSSYMGARPAGPACGDPFHAHPTGDLNSDCYVNLPDEALFAQSWNESCVGPGWCGGSDFDKNGTVDLDDFVSGIVSNWLDCTDPAAPCSFNP